MGSKGIVASSAAHGHPAAAGHRRHHPHLADAGAGRRPHARGAGGAGTAADHGLPRVRADRRGLPRLRPHHLDRCSRSSPRTSRTIIRDDDAGVERALSRRRGAQGRGDGLHRQRPGRNPSTPTSASRCPAPARRRPRRSSSTARRPRRCAARRSPPISRRWWPTTSSGASAPAGPGGRRRSRSLVL